MQAIENQATAAPSSLDEVPADAVAVVAAYAGFFDRAKLAVCGKLMSQACAKVTSELLIVQNFVAGDSNTREVFIGDDSNWRRCADPPNNFWSVDQTVCIDGRACVVSDENGARGARLAAQVSIYDPKRDEWCSEGGVKELEDSKWYGCCAFEGNLVFVGGHTSHAYRPSEQNYFSTVLAVDPKTLAAEPMVSLPFPRYGAICGVADGKLFVLGGSVANYSSKEPQEEQIAHESKVLVLERRDGQEDAWAEFVELPPELRKGHSLTPDLRPHARNCLETNVCFREHRIYVIGNDKDYTVRVLDVRTKVWSTVDDTTLKAHWRRPRGPQYGFPEDLDQYDPEPTVHDETTIRLLDTEDRVGGPTLRTGGKRPASFPVISYRGDFAVFETAGDEDYAYQASPDEWEDMDTPAIYVLTGGNTWIPTGGRLGCTASRELYKSRGELFPDVYHVAAPPAWLQEMPVCLTQPWYSTWTDGAYEGTDYGRYASRMSHIESGRFCVVKA